MKQDKDSQIEFRVKLFQKIIQCGVTSNLKVLKIEEILLNLKVEEQQ